MKLYQAKLEERQASAEVISRAKCQFLTNVSHELRTLNGKPGFDYLLPPAGQQREYTELIQNSPKSLLWLIDDIVNEGTIEKLAAPDASPDRIATAEDTAEYDILLAEDHPIDVHLALAVLQVAGCETEHAENGEQALAKLENADFDLIIMDSQMPVLNGIETTKRIRSRSDWKGRIPILSLTADATKDQEGKCLSAGANVYLTKPFKVDCFIATVATLARHGRDIRQNRATSPADKMLL